MMKLMKQGSGRGTNDTEHAAFASGAATEHAISGNATEHAISGNATEHAEKFVAGVAGVVAS